MLRFKCGVPESANSIQTRSIGAVTGLAAGVFTISQIAFNKRLSVGSPAAALTLKLFDESQSSEEQD